MYREMAQRLGPGIDIYGVPVQRRELMGVMHLKGLIFDDRVLYSGASLNDVYLNRHQRYRLDRYHLINNQVLADCMANLLTGLVRDDPAVHPLDSGRVPKTVALRNAIISFRRRLARSRYHFTEGRLKTGEIGITPLLGLGVRDNELNAALLQLVRRAQQRLVLFTPYFNLPGPVRRALDKKIKSGATSLLFSATRRPMIFIFRPTSLTRPSVRSPIFTKLICAASARRTRNPSTPVGSTCSCGVTKTTASISRGCWSMRTMPC